MSEERAPPYGEVDPKRPFAVVPVIFDWHDYLANLWEPGTAYALNDVIRPKRADSTGLEYKCTVAGVSGKTQPNWPRIAGATFSADGSVTWTAQAVSAASLRATIATSDFPAVTGVTLGTEADVDLRYSVLVGSGLRGQDYEIRHQVALSNGEQQEGLALLPVRD